MSIRGGAVCRIRAIFAGVRLYTRLTRSLRLCQGQGFGGEDAGWGGLVSIVSTDTCMEENMPEAAE
jgi:hypothetical protein